MDKKEFEKSEKEKEEKYNAFVNRWEKYIETFVEAGFTKEQAQKLAQEFADLKSI